MKKIKNLLILVLVPTLLAVPLLSACSGSRASEIISGLLSDDDQPQLDEMQSSVMDLLEDFVDPMEVSIVGSDISISDDTPDMTLKQLIASYNWRIVMGTVTIPAEGHRFILKAEDGSMLYILEDLNYMVLRYTDGSTKMIQTDDLEDYTIYQLLANWVLSLTDDTEPEFSDVQISSSTAHRIIAIESLSQPIGSTVELVAVPTPSETEVECSWRCDDDSIATVDEDGIVTCLAAGNCTITLDAYDPITDTTLSDTITLTVIE